MSVGVSSIDVQVCALPTPPGPEQPLDVEFIVGKKSHLNVQKLHHTYGPVCGCMCEGSYLVIISGYDNIYDTLVKRSVDFASRPDQWPSLVYNPNKLGIADGELSEPWKKQRQFFLVSIMKLGVGKQLFEDKVRREGSSLMMSLAYTKGSALYIDDYLAMAVFNVVHELLFGFRYRHDDSAFESLLTDIEKFFNKASPMIHTDSEQKKLKKAVNKLMEYVKKQIEKHESSLNAQQPRDFIDLYLLELRKPDATQNGFTRDQMVMLLFDFLSAAIITMTTTLQWAVLYLTNRPELQDKLHKEIMANTNSDGADEPLRLSDQQRLPFTCSTLLEIQRLACVPVMTPPHKSVATDGDVELLGYKLPHNAEIVANIWSVHQDPSLFEQPEVLKPERFLDADGNFVHDKHVIPFSLGARGCIGQKIAKIELFIFFTELIRNFRFVAPSGKHLSEEGEVEEILVPKRFKVKCIPRA